MKQLEMTEHNWKSQDVAENDGKWLVIARNSWKSMEIYGDGYNQSGMAGNI